MCIQGEPCQKVVFLIQGTAAVLRRSKRRVPFTHTPSKDEVARQASIRLKANFDKLQQFEEDANDVDVGDEEGGDDEHGQLELLSEMHPGTVMSCWYLLL